MHSKYILLILLFSLSFFTACEEEGVLNVTNNKAVVEGFIFANQGIDSLRISKSIGYSNSVTEQETLDDLSVFIYEGTEVISLTSIGDGYYQNLNYICQENQSYQLSFEYEGVEVNAETYVPETKVASLSNTEIYLYQVVDFNDIALNLDVDPLEVTWNNSEGEYYYVVIENIEENPEEINLLTLPGGGGRFRFISEPEIVDFYAIDARRGLQQFGTHRVIVFRVNPEYVALYETTESSSQTINEPPSNITNGLGVFTGISSDTLYFEVRKN